MHVVYCLIFIRVYAAIELYAKIKLTMKGLLFLIFASQLFSRLDVYAQNKADSIFPVRGFCIAAPGKAQLNRFVQFVDKELAGQGVNTLVLRIDWNYQFESHPELRDSNALSKDDIRKLVNVAKKNRIRLIPQINLLGHQSWAGQIENLLRVYPEFDETPHVKMPGKYVWPNEDGLYCKSYCPLHPGIHKIVFELIDEICDVFETDAFHAGMDEVFYIGDDKCPRCGGRDKAELFAGEVNKIQQHLALSGRKLLIWGDRLIDGKITGIGMWEASFNNTHRAVDLISKEVVICDWHYERPDQTAVYFAMKGFNVITCPWRNPLIAVEQANDIFRFRKNGTEIMKPRFNGMMQTVWSGAESFMDEYYKEQGKPASNNTATSCFKAVFEEIRKIASAN
jgi:hypothetical protein